MPVTRNVDRERKKQLETERNARDYQVAITKGDENTARLRPLRLARDSEATAERPA